ncbi:MAG: glycoside hydrolase family 127 protein [Bacteroidales bacterium]|nr:glycoside hydrolase family 127 protein [Bacteroidales bacterium]MBN2698281.1 glycoside hydrolase family 127 protein [Bacteroidales bacterium]
MDPKNRESVTIANPAFVIILLVFPLLLNGQDKAPADNSRSPFALMMGVNGNDVALTSGFWAERFIVCRDTMVPFMWSILNDADVSHAFRNFEIAAGHAEGNHSGPPFHDGDFYKWFESLVSVYMQTRKPELDEQMDDIIRIIAGSQREDGYIHTPVIIEQRKRSGNDLKAEFRERLDFETYNMGHLMTAACLHYRATGKETLLNVAVKAADFLIDFYNRDPEELAQNAICPSHYMGIIELYRVTGEKKYLDLGRNLIDIRRMVRNGTDHNQDRIPFREQTEAIGHAVRANYLYAGVADLVAETGDTTLLRPLEMIWNDLVKHKLYITGGCGALYDGVSPDGTTYNQPYIQQVHQAYGRPYQLPNITAHNESCANIGSVLWNWRMLMISGEAKYAEMVEQTLYNSVLSAVSLDGKRYFYTNPLRVDFDLPYTLRWSKEREEYISLCNCCPPNVVRTVSEIHNYLYSLSEGTVWFHLYGSSHLDTHLPDGSKVILHQETDYPWEGTVMLTLEEVPRNNLILKLRIPSWADGSKVYVNEQLCQTPVVPGTYLTIEKNWRKGDKIRLELPVKTKLIESNPLVEETRNELAVRRGPIVYCLESPDLPQNVRVSDIGIPADIHLSPEKIEIDGSQLISLKGEALIINQDDWDDELYREISDRQPVPLIIRLIPYFAWGNRGKSEMTVWIPACR